MCRVRPRSRRGVTARMPTMNFRSSVPPEAWQDLIARGRRRTFPRGTLLLRQGESPDSVIALVEGQVRVTQLSESGDELVLMLRGPGEVLGEMGALVGQPRSASVMAARRCTGMVLPAHAFRGYVDRHGFQDVIYRLTVERLHRHERLRVRLLHTNRVVRIAIVVSALAEELGRPEGTTVVVDLGVARAELAAMASMKRSSAATALRQLQTDGVLSLTGRRLVVTDPEGLAAAARGEAYGRAPDPV
ncbi:Crp/Fnr family transcriptional regulator [Kitasatospora cineracea]|uniref:Crp/Fnr family transcriptional regulator n=1 Tax=Kitasatospora cineracea TaxID=88074 RepID=UPI003404418A